MSILIKELLIYWKYDSIKSQKENMNGALGMIKFAIIDDNIEMHKVILRLLEKTQSLSALEWSYESFYSSEEFMLKKENNRFDIILLDIELPDMSGIELSEWIRTQSKDNYIIFLTSYEHYMKDAFGLNIHSYVLKENMNEELPNTIEKLLNLTELQEKPKIKFRSNIGEIELVEDDIICVIYEDRRPVIYTKNKSIIVYSETLNSVYTKLSDSLFIQPNSGTIINVKYIKEIKNPSIRMKDYPELIHISRGKLKLVVESYRDYFMQGETV